MRITILSAQSTLFTLFIMRITILFTQSTQFFTQFTLFKTLFSRSSLCAHTTILPNSLVCLQVQTWAIDDQYMLGDALMMAPAGMDRTNGASRDVYFPDTAPSWHPWFDNSTSCVQQPPPRCRFLWGCSLSLWFCDTLVKLLACLAYLRTSIAFKV